MTSPARSRQPPGIIQPPATQPLSKQPLSRIDCAILDATTHSGDNAMRRGQGGRVPIPTRAEIDKSEAQSREIVACSGVRLGPPIYMKFAFNNGDSSTASLGPTGAHHLLSALNGHPPSLTGCPLECEPLGSRGRSPGAHVAATPALQPPMHAEAVESGRCSLSREISRERRGRLTRPLTIVLQMLRRGVSLEPARPRVADDLSGLFH